MSDTLYLKIDRNIAVSTKDVTLGDVAKMECINKPILNKLKTLRILKIPDNEHGRYVYSVVKIIELIHTVNPQLEVNNLGEADFIIELSTETNDWKHKVYEFVKVLFVCLIIFFGGAFAIMTFNNDVLIPKLFKEIYHQVTGVKSDGFTILELTYSIGVSLGVIIFYNHFGKKKITKDPTPVEVEMRLYEDDINTTLIEGANRKETHIDVD